MCLTVVLLAMLATRVGQSGKFHSICKKHDIFYTYPEKKTIKMLNIL